jgi:hypothetical protein
MGEITSGLGRLQTARFRIVTIVAKFSNAINFTAVTDRRALSVYQYREIGAEESVAPFPFCDAPSGRLLAPAITRELKAYNSLSTIGDTEPRKPRLLNPVVTSLYSGKLASNFLLSSCVAAVGKIGR